MATYTSKLERGQLAWFLRENTVVSMPVGSVTIKSVEGVDGPSSETIVYGFRIYTAGHKFEKWEEHYQSKCFASKDELLASL